MTARDDESSKTQVDRRSVLGLATSAVIGGAAASTAPAAAAGIRSDIVMLDAVALASAIHARQLSCV